LRDDFLATPVAPLVTAARALQADGAAANVNLTLGSVTPTLSWTAPSTGTAQIYQILMYELTASGTTTTRTFRHVYRTTQTSKAIPAGHMTSGHKYYIKITAMTAATDLGASPYRWHLPFGFADTVSGVLTAP
jgi:hypothetical protein